MKHEAWMQAVDLQKEAHKWTLSKLGDGYIQKFHEGLFKVDRQEFSEIQSIDLVSATSTANEYREALHRSDVMYVTGEMQQIIHSAAEDIPGDLEFHDHNLLCNSGFVLFHDSIVGEDVRGDGIVMKGLLWHKAVVRMVPSDPLLETAMLPCVLLWMLSDIQDERDGFTQFIRNNKMAGKFQLAGEPEPSRLLPAHLLVVPMDQPYLAEWPDAPGSAITELLARMFIALNLVAQQNIAETAKMRTPRAARRRWNLDQNSIITLITLRRKKMALPDDHVPQKVEWSRRWVVRGFWRNQYYPKTKTHDWKYIHEYIKGPEDKPLVITERRVFNFRR